MFIAKTLSLVQLTRTSQPPLLRMSTAASSPIVTRVLASSVAIADRCHLSILLKCSCLDRAKTRYNRFGVLLSYMFIARAGEIVRAIWSGGDLGIVEKTGKDDLQTQADR